MTCENSHLVGIEPLDDWHARKLLFQVVFRTTS